MSVSVRPAVAEDMDVLMELIRLLASYEHEESQVEVRRTIACSARHSASQLMQPVSCMQPASQPDSQSPTVFPPCSHLD